MCDRGVVTHDHPRACHSRKFLKQIRKHTANTQAAGGRISQHVPDVKFKPDWKTKSSQPKHTHEPVTPTPKQWHSEVFNGVSANPKAWNFSKKFERKWEKKKEHLNLIELICFYLQQGICVFQPLKLNVATAHFNVAR